MNEREQPAVKDEDAEHPIASAWRSTFREKLVELSDETWKSSVAQWMRTHWEVLVDLRTEGEGRSDLVLDARVYEVEAGYRFKVHAVYVP